MIGQRAAREPYTTRFETEVTAIDGRRVWLETSFFYAASDGQPADRGTIGGVSVDDVRTVDGEHVHVLETEPSFRTGHHVLCSIDWSFRMYCMRAHTASHICYGAARRVLEPAEATYVGHEIGEETVGLDLETGSIDDEALIELDASINRVVWESRPVSWDDVSIEDAREREEITFDEERTAAAVESGRVRTVTIGNRDESGNGNGSSFADTRRSWDVTACDGTHVRNTREVGPVTVVGRTTRDDGSSRIELAVGPAAIERRAAEKRAVLAVTDELGVDLDRVPRTIDRLDASSEQPSPRD
ncbi:alanyl-tRNA synthetase [Natronorubrum sediminis]|uniref:Alanyl-tRNA synthetase n=1 Tax=Natronorubrum sediminis TaxID=640943 RepID=A0A1H6FYA2_9EURY|nr:alanyl-tRNA editing protein [Natronorubrum sediminis]SEH15799.1 alanyl-tRNA synthetase [Natronorubrum sediminis]